jgi:hypothetical protein
MKDIATLMVTSLNLVVALIVLAYSVTSYQRTQEQKHNSIYYLVKPSGMVAATFYGHEKCMEYRNMYRQTHRLYYTCTP